MKSIILALTASALTICFSYGQTTVIADGSGNLNVPKLVSTTSSGQSFFTGRQYGNAYAFPMGIFHAVTDNPNGAANTFIDGVAGNTTTFSVRADGQGYFAGKIGIGTTSPRALLDIGSYLSSGQLGAVLGRLQEGDTQDGGTYLGVKGYDTQGSNIANVKSFAIEHTFYGMTNSSINFFRG